MTLRWESGSAGFRSAELREKTEPPRGARSVPATRWIVAHLDTKAQVQSMAGRLVAVWARSAWARRDCSR